MIHEHITIWHGNLDNLSFETGLIFLIFTPPVVVCCHMQYAVCFCAYWLHPELQYKIGRHLDTVISTPA